MVNDPGTDTVTLEDVLYISDGLVPIVEYKGERFGLPYRLIEPGTNIRNPGDRGTVVLARVVAEWMGLLDRHPPNEVFK
jgi:hypothetical protein